MKSRVALALALVGFVVACGGGDSPTEIKPPKPDPYITVRVRDLLDTTTNAGRAGWRVYALLTGPEVNQNGIAYRGSITLAERRSGAGQACMSVGADSIGQRLISPFAIADTTTTALADVSRTDSIVARWWAGNHAPATGGFMILAVAPTDAWNSAQYLAGHGLVSTDPIRWSWDWTGVGATTFVERSATDTGNCYNY